MASFDTLQERLTALQETTGQLKDLIDRLANIKFQPGSVPLSNADEDNVATELSTEISHTLREEEEDLELLHEEIIDLRSGRPGSEAEHRKTRLKEGAQRLEAELKDCRTAFRRAQLSARRSLEAAQKQERSLLLASYAASAAATTSAPSGRSSPAASSTPQRPPDTDSPPHHQDPSAPLDNSPRDPADPHRDADPRDHLFTPRDRRRLLRSAKNGHRSGEPDVLAASADVTLSLRRTHALVAGELARSAFAARTLAESSAALAELERSYAGVEGLLARSRGLVGALLTARKSDTWYLRAALRLLLATLAWLLFRRLLYGPLWWLVWLPVRTGWRVGKGVLPGLGGAGAPPPPPRSLAGGGSGMEAVVVVAGRPGGGPEEGAVPTVQVGQGKKKDMSGKEEAGEGDPDSMVEKVGRMVDDTLNLRAAGDDEEKTRTADDEVASDAPNPMKRIWEEEQKEAEVAGAQEQARDEL